MRSTLQFFSPTLVLLFGVVVSMPGDLLAQGVTTAAINGVVTDVNGKTRSPTPVSLPFINQAAPNTARSSAQEGVTTSPT
jgi:hypothetical protein